MHLNVKIVLPVVGEEVVEISNVEKHKIQHHPSFVRKLVVQLLHCHPSKLGIVDNLYQLFYCFFYQFICLLT